MHSNSDLKEIIEADAAKDRQLITFSPMDEHMLTLTSIWKRMDLDKISPITDTEFRKWSGAILNMADVTTLEVMSIDQANEMTIRHPRRSEFDTNIRLALQAYGQGKWQVPLRYLPKAMRPQRCQATLAAPPAQ